MPFSSISTTRSAVVALIVSGIAFLESLGMAYAQGNNTSGQSGYKKEDPGDYSDKNDPIQGHTGEPYSEKGSSIKGKESSEKRNTKNQ